MSAKLPMYLTKDSYTRSQKIKFCKHCNDTAFELLDNLKPTNRCARCGKEFKNGRN